MQCPNCKLENPTDSQFCEDCGSTLHGTLSTVESLPEPPTGSVTGGLNKREFNTLSESLPDHKPAVLYRHITSEMVGRENELSLLEFQIIKAIMGEGSVVNVVGDAGIGKSRLIAETKKLEVMKKVTVFESRASSIGRNLSFHPVIDLFRNWAKISDSDSETTKSEKLHDSIRSINPDVTAEIFPFVATLMGLKLTGAHAERVQGIEGEALEKLIFKNVKELLFQGLQLGPIVIIMEDIHWADASSMSLLAYLYPVAEKHGIVFINVFRPGYIHTDYANIMQVGSRLNVQRLEVEIQPLDKGESETLIDNMLVSNPVPQAIKLRIIDRAAGSPFFIEELVHSLIDEGIVISRDSGFEVTEQINSVFIPPTLKGLLLARIGRLDQQTGELLKIASVLGKSFFVSVLQDVADSVEDIEGRLAHLQSVQLIRVRSNTGEREYLFKHALIQEAAYESMPDVRRKKVHLRVAESMEQTLGDGAQEYYGLLAYHYGKAEVMDKTEEFLVKAGEESLKSSASNEALSYYREALNLYLLHKGEDADPQKIALLEKNIGQAFFNRGLYVDAVAHFDKALNYYWGELPTNSVSSASKLLSSLVKFMGALYYPSYWFKELPTPKDVETVELYYKKAQALALIDPKRFFTEFFFFHATAVRFDLTKFKFGMGIFASSSALFAFTGFSFRIARKVLDYAGPRLDQQNAKQVITYNLLDTQHLFLKGEWNKISEYDQDLVDKMLRVGEVWDAAQHYYWHGLPKIFQGHFNDARLMITKLNELAEIYRNNIYRLLKYLLNIYLLIERREIQEAGAEVDRGIDLVKTENWPLSILNIYSLKASIDLLRNDMDQAEKSLDIANQVRMKMRVAPIQLSAFYRSLFDYNLRHFEHTLEAGLKDEARVYRKNAEHSAKSLVKVCQKAALYRTDSYRLMGVYKSLTGDHKGACKWWGKAIMAGESLGALPQLSRTYGEMAFRISMDGDRYSQTELDTAKDALEKSREMFARLGLPEDLDKLNSMTGRISLKPFQT